MTGQERGRLCVLCIAGSLVHGGAERHSITLVNGLAARGHEGHLAWVKNDSAQLDRLKRDGRAFAHCLGATRYLERRALADLARLMDRVSPDVIVAQNPYALMYASRARRLARVPAPVVTVFHSNRLLGPGLIGLIRDVAGNYAPALLVCMALKLVGGSFVLIRKR